MADKGKSGEFDLIERYFAPLAGPAGLGLRDDAALFSVPDGMEAVVTKDMLLERVHFLPGDPPETLGRKALAVNLSDLAAKGAIPRYYWLGLALPKPISEDWCARFTDGLARMQAESGILLAGGDTTASPGGIVISITALGEVPKGQMITRSGAKAGDDIYVTGTLGDGALGLLCLQGKLGASPDLEARYRTPTPRIQVGMALMGLASAGADISDGLIADLGHICAGSGLGATVEQALLPLSVAASAALANDSGLWPLVWSGGDDYELVFTASPYQRPKIHALGVMHGLKITRIGTMMAEAGVRLVDPAGKLVQIDRQGYQHF